MIRKYSSLLVSGGLFLLMFGCASIVYPNFFSIQVLLNLFIDNAFLGITAIGMTFVILSGGIDLSVGSVIALTTMISAYLLETVSMDPMVVIAIVLIIGSSLGFLMGCMINFFKVAPFIATLAGQFLARGLCYTISIDAISIKNPLYHTLSYYRIPFVAGTSVTVSALLFFLIIGTAVYIAHYTRFGRVIYAIGGNEQSALLMGLPIGKTKILVYTLSGFCSSLAGIVFSLYTLSGYALHGKGLELDAIAATVIGGTLLTGGTGYIIGTVIGTMILGTIQTIIIFQGDLSSWWTKIAIGILIFFFIFFQNVTRVRDNRKSYGTKEKLNNKNGQ